MEFQLELQQIKGKLLALLSDIDKLTIKELPEGQKADKVIDVILNYAGVGKREFFRNRSEGKMFYKRIMCYVLHDYCHLTHRQVAEKVRLKKPESAKTHTDKMRWWMANPEYAPKDAVLATKNLLNELGYEK
jgi:hypothetical protein